MASLVLSVEVKKISRVGVVKTAYGYCPKRTVALDSTNAAHFFLRTSVPV